MNTFDAVMICEGVEDATQEELIAAWQSLIDDGTVWTLQGSFGRQAKAMIEAGVCYSAQDTVHDSGMVYRSECCGASPHEASPDVGSDNLAGICGQCLDGTGFELGEEE